MAPVVLVDIDVLRLAYLAELYAEMLIRRNALGGLVGVYIAR